MHHLKFQSQGVIEAQNKIEPNKRFQLAFTAIKQGYDLKQTSRRVCCAERVVASVLRV